MNPRLLLLCVLVTFVMLTTAGCAPARVQEVDQGAKTRVDRSFGDMVSDQRLRSRIVGKILNDDELLEYSHINVTVFNQVILITGEVPNTEAGRRIATFARQQNDARRVHNELMVTDMSSVMARGRDGLINRNARTRILQLGDHPGLADRVRVVTERRRLYLLGRVSRKEADAVSETVRRVSGVREVVRMFDYLD